MSAKKNRERNRTRSTKKRERKEVEAQRIGSAKERDTWQNSISALQIVGIFTTTRGLQPQQKGRFSPLYMKPKSYLTDSDISNCICKGTWIEMKIAKKIYYRNIQQTKTPNLSEASLFSFTLGALKAVRQQVLVLKLPTALFLRTGRRNVPVSFVNLDRRHLRWW